MKILHIQFYKNLNVFISTIPKIITLCGNAFIRSDCSFFNVKWFYITTFTTKLTTLLYILNYNCIIYIYAQTAFYEDKVVIYVFCFSQKWHREDCIMTFLHTVRQPK